MSETLARVQGLIERGAVRISDHGYDELAADSILIADIIESVRDAVLVEDYPTAFKGPSVLVLQRDSTGRPIHVLWAVPAGQTEPAVLVTAYRPDPQKWSDDLTRRSERWNDKENR
jgi:hypothetical protein